MTCATSESHDNGLWVRNGFHALAGEAVTRKAGTGPGGTLNVACDASGNLITRNGSSVGWTSYKLPATINAAG